MTFMDGSVHGGGGAWTGLCSSHGLYDREGPARDPDFAPNRINQVASDPMLSVGHGDPTPSILCLSAMGTWGKK